MNVFAEYSSKFSDFMFENPMELSGKHIEPFPFFYKYRRNVSSVQRVYYENDILIIEHGNDEEKYRYNTSTGNSERISFFKERKISIAIPKNKIPFALGRNFRANLTASAKIWDNKYLVGTEDGILFLWDGVNAFNLGACPNTSGEVKEICYCEHTRKAYGIIGSKNDIAIVFSFNEKQGVRYLGRAHFNIESGLYLSCELSSIAVNSDGTKIAIGSGESMGIAYEITI
jgi:hypothetical protein